MAFCSVAVSTTSATEQVLGQSFTPNIPGPDGDGNPGSIVQILSLTVGYAHYEAATATSVALFDGPKNSAGDMSQPARLVGVSSSFFDGDSFGGGIFTRTFVFDGVEVESTTRLYAYLSESQTLNIQGEHPYSGGAMLDVDGEEEPSCALQFRVTMSS